MSNNDTKSNNDPKSEVTNAAQNVDAEQLEKNLNNDDEQATDHEDNQAPFIDESLRTDQ